MGVLEKREGPRVRGQGPPQGKKPLDSQGLHPPPDVHPLGGGYTCLSHWTLKATLSGRKAGLSPPIRTCSTQAGATPHFLCRVGEPEAQRGAETRPKLQSQDSSHREQRRSSSPKLPFTNGEHRAQRGAVMCPKPCRKREQEGGPGPLGACSQTQQASGHLQSPQALSGPEALGEARGG